ncbi:hypothetical protein ACG83_15705 [Frankia sp. R43]|uniref:hypothetical protein n=1 Tax=Frankia sp. R43 TaxID=269536 RepID=UPI0006CA3528|nr:hypothetical protein [Frankia sp. R43]KPM54858.1 hypothetical protein ACG83_15705 [Frankia sp. R43]
MNNETVYAIVWYEGGPEPSIGGVLLPYESVAAAERSARMRHLDGYDVAPIEFDVAPDTEPSGAGLVIQ